MARNEFPLNQLAARLKLPEPMSLEEIEANKARQQRRAESLIATIKEKGDSVLFGEKLDNYLEWSELHKRGVLSKRLKKKLSEIENLFTTFFGDWQNKVVEAWEDRLVR